jgi:hypothetical protein
MYQLHHGQKVDNKFSYKNKSAIALMSVAYLQNYFRKFKSI